MSTDPRVALQQLIVAFERHLEAVSARRGEDDPTVGAAYDDLLDAFETYDNALYETYGEMTPLDAYSGDDDGDDDDDFDDDLDDDGVYLGLDDEEFDDDDRGGDSGGDTSADASQSRT